MLCHNSDGILKYELLYKNGENITEDLNVSLNSLCNINKEPFEYYWDVLYDSLGVFMKDFYTPFSGKLVINSYEDTIDYFVDINSEISYKHGLKDGKTKFYFESGLIESEINYKNNKINGLAKNYFENRKIKGESNYKNDKLNGLSSYYYKNGQLQTQVNYKDGEIIDNEIKEFYDNGKIKSISKYKNGILDGLKQEFYENEQIKSKIEYVEGKINGKWIYWKKNGELLDSGELFDGTGVIKHYFDNQNLKYEANYKNGEFDGLVAEYFENGQPKEKANYSNGKYNGNFIKYFENEQIKEKSNYKNGDLDGKQLIYYEDGILYEENNFKNGEKNGWQLTYYTNGKLKYDLFYVNGEINYSKRDYKKINPRIKKCIKFVKAKLEKYDKDYDRKSKPYSAHVRAYFQFKNISNKKITAIKFDFTFKDVFEDILYDNSAKYDLNLSSGEKNSMNIYWYWEDSYSSPYSKLWSPVESGNVKTEVTVTKIVFSDGSIIE
ncbi:MAG: toxin-antitoxin system YwqK family antitoxin [Candidatus Cloacimonetes bacterium]|nr:toxin-antitoxin system YwqK family antitoxin [Candidatus Cloacimonadota bacterium]